MGVEFDRDDVSPSPWAETGERRRGDRRRLTDRRASDRRGAVEAERMHLVGLIASVLAFAAALWALTHAPLTSSPTACAGSLGGQTTWNRSISPWALAAVLLGVVAAIVPTRRKRSAAALVLIGLTAGLLVAAFVRIGTWTTGLCLA